MKPGICLIFKVHQPQLLRQYRFFDIGNDSHYYDDFACRSAIRSAATHSYLPMNKMVLDLIASTKGKLKVAYAISGTALTHMDRYCPELLDSFRELAATGCVEFICEPFYHSLCSVASDIEFAHQVDKHKAALKQYLGVEPETFVNTDMVYNDAIGDMVYGMGFKTMITDGARHILGWRSPNFVYTCAMNSKLKLLLRNSPLSDDILMRFGRRDWDQWPLTAEKYYGWVKQNAADQVVNLAMNYRVFGEYNNAESGIFDFFRSFVNQVVSDGVFSFVTPAQAAKNKAVGALEVVDTISAEEEARDLGKWLGNELQKDAFNKLYDLREKIALINLPQLWEDFGYLQETDHFYNMNTKFFSEAGVHSYINPYDTPYEAFINYMNVLGDFAIRVQEELD